MELELCQTGPIFLHSVVLVQLGWLPIEHAALRDCREEVEMLFPLTSPIPNVPNWSVNGIIAHAKVKNTKPMVRFVQICTFDLSVLKVLLCSLLIFHVAYHALCIAELYFTHFTSLMLVRL